MATKTTHPAVLKAQAAQAAAWLAGARVTGERPR